MVHFFLSSTIMFKALQLFSFTGMVSFYWPHLDRVALRTLITFHLDASIRPAAEFTRKYLLTRKNLHAIEVTKLKYLLEARTSSVKTRRDR